MSNSVARSISNFELADRHDPLMVRSCLTSHFISDPNVLADFALDNCLALVDGTIGSFFLWDESEKALVLKAARGPARQKIVGTRIRLREGVAGWIAEKGRSVLVRDVQSDVRFSSMNREGRYRTFSFLSLPLVAHNKLIGLINVTEKDNFSPFTDEDLETARHFADHIAIAYDRVKVETRLQRENEGLTKTVADLKDALQGQESLASIGKFSSQIAHELNNPLDAVRRYVNLALDQLGEDSIARDYLLKAKKGMRQSLQVIRGLLAFSRKNGRSKVRKVDLHDLIEGVVTTTRQQPNFEKIKIERDFCHGPVVIEEFGLQVVFQNLFQNAYDAMEGEGALTIATKRVNGQVVVSIRDKGCGIANDIMAHVFEPFFTTKDHEKGTGLGLSICREVVHRCGGQITFKSKVNQGTEFIVSLPCSEEEAVQS